MPLRGFSRSFRGGAVRRCPRALMSQRARELAILLSIAVAAVSGDVGAQRALSPVTDAMLRQPDPADWLMWRRTHDAWGYSPLAQIDTTNVGRLAMVWSRPLSAGLQEGTPLVHDGVMFMPNPSDVVQAIDA